MELGELFILIAVLVVSLADTIGSFWYFKVVKSKYRWIKLFWGLQMLVFTLIIVFTIVTSGAPNISIQFMALLLPTTALFYGLISAFSRQKELEYIAALEEKLNGDMHAWLEENIKNLPPRKV